MNWGKFSIWRGGKSSRLSRQSNKLSLSLAGMLPHLVVAPSFMICLVVVYGYIVWTGYFSVSASRMLPDYGFVGWMNYQKLWATPRWFVALHNIGIFAPAFIFFSTLIGLALAIFLDQKIRIEGTLRTIYLYPMAISFIVTGTTWKWILDPGFGIPNMIRMMGWETFRFDWIVQGKYAIYCVVMAAVWQASGFAMAVFLAALRGVNNEIINAARIDGASMIKIYRQIVIPLVRPAFITVIILLTHMAIKSFDLVIALTGGGPGYSTELPSTFIYSSIFSRNQIGVGSASAIIMLATIAAIMIPYLYSELRERKSEG